MFTAAGKGMDYMPGAASLTATHKGKVKNLRLTALREKTQGLPPEANTLNLEKVTKQYDSDQEQASGEQPHMAEYKTIGHEKLLPLSEVFAKAKFIEVDVTYTSATVLEYLLNIVTFNYTTMECESLS